MWDVHANRNLLFLCCFINGVVLRENPIGPMSPGFPMSEPVYPHDEPQPVDPRGGTPW
jgi:hypothetical protein